MENMDENNVPTPQNMNEDMDMDMPVLTPQNVNMDEEIMDSIVLTPRNVNMENENVELEILNDGMLSTPKMPSKVSDVSIKFLNNLLGIIT